MPKRTIQRIYEESWSAYLSRGKGIPTGDNEFANQIASLVGNQKHCLDIGCGTGKCMLALSKLGNKVIGVDVSPSAITIRKSLGLEVLCLDIENDEIDPLLGYSPFDFIIMTDVLEHLIDPIEVLSKIRTLLKKDGTVIATVPNFVYFRYRFSLLLGTISHFGNDDATGYDPPRPYNLGHKTLFNRSNLEQTFKLSGFSRVIVVPELFSESLKPWWRVPVFRNIRLLAKKIWPTMLAARFLVIAHA